MLYQLQLIPYQDRRKNDGRLVDHVHTLWQRELDSNSSYGAPMLLLLLHERKRAGGTRMNCKKCEKVLEFHTDAWPIEIQPGVWTELWVCPDCGEERVA
jgi:hypothetical protein